MNKYPLNIVIVTTDCHTKRPKVKLFFVWTNSIRHIICYICHTVKYVLHMVIIHNLTEKSKYYLLASPLTQSKFTLTPFLSCFFFLIIVKCIAYDKWTHIHVAYFFSFNQLTIFSGFFLVFFCKITFLFNGWIIYALAPHMKIMTKKNSAFYYNYYFRVGKSSPWTSQSPWLGLKIKLSKTD